MTSEQKLHPLREGINQARLKEQEARIAENQFGEQLKESGAYEEELMQALGKTRPSRIAGRDKSAQYRNSCLGSGQSGCAGGVAIFPGT